MSNFICTRIKNISALGIYSTFYAVEGFCIFIVTKTMALTTGGKRVSFTSHLRRLCLLEGNPRINAVLHYILESEFEMS